MAQETVERFNPAKELPIITHGLPYPQACAKHLKDTLHRSRPFLVISNSLGRNTDAIERLRSALDNDHVALAGVHVGMKPHTYYSEVLQVAREVRDSGADCIVTIGGGSLIDGAKAMSLVLANNADTHEELDILFRATNALRHGQPTPEGGPRMVRPSSIPVLSITTTLSAGEFNPPGGSTNDATDHKQVFCNPAGVGISVIVMDPALARTTPERVWLSSGLRAVDHCVETICSSNPTEEGTRHSLRGIRLLVPGLLKIKQGAGDDAEAWLKCQLGAAESMKAVNLYGVKVGGSHGIGHQIGPLGVPHAETTCICLPAVQKFNAKANAEQQQIVLDAFWSDPDIAGALTRHNLVKGQADLGDALDAVIRELGFPRTLKDYGIGRDKLEAIAESSLKDACCQWNAIPLEKKEQVLEILEMCLGDQ
ncbi:Alcohol dehydrogenase 4 [Cytospora mali]|uniref:Alcohol dehydrogenase 4 n=1 Tax=Cytospora mali TaxID=578113 RepID=A0A194V324_CYTMA|nr:Alcohol dehydrogenase 4 [Valsa mali var. pyri (nom. inval.)]